ncbi:MAG: hypothetical protein DMG07_07665 [Acidobacteria bacterium]|nr:MAG: hypothetical protein DMG07_07665 [Acidobacteriota bacterium]
MRDAPNETTSGFARLYNRVILGHPTLVVLAFAAGIVFFGYHARRFRLDASSDSLVLENDADLKYYEQTRQLFGSDDYIVLAFSLGRPVLDDDVLRSLRALSDELEKIPAVESVNSILTVPLFQSPKVSLYDMGTKHTTLEMPACDRRLAFLELTESPLWRNNLISPDGRTTSIVLTFKPDPVYNRLGDERYQLRRRGAEGKLTRADAARLRAVSRSYDERHAELSAQRRADVARIRASLSRYRAAGYDFVESGVPMIVADMVSYIERDIVVFGIGILAFLMLVLVLLFRELRWVLLPIVTCAIPVVFLMGYLGLTSWETTVVSANFSSLLLIVVMQNAIYLMVRFREIHARRHDMATRQILLQTVREISVPCFYASSTMVAGFATLLISGIVPVIDFGWLMAIGVSFAYVVNFTFFPAAILLFPKGAPPPAHLATLDRSPVSFLADFSRRHRAAIAAVAVALLAGSIAGVRKLQVENRFIDYFRKGTPI